MADMLSFRLKQRPVRLAAATSTLAVSPVLPAGADGGTGGSGGAAAQHLQDYRPGFVIAVVAVLMIVYVLIGGMRGTAWVQIIKAVLLIGGAAMMTVMVLAKFGVDLSRCWAPPVRRSPDRRMRPSPAATSWRPAPSTAARYVAVQLFLSLALALGTAGLPHVLMRFYTVPTAREPGAPVVWAIALIGAFYLFTLALGYGAAALVGPDEILAAPGAQNSAILAFFFGGVVLLGCDFCRWLSQRSLRWSPA